MSIALLVIAALNAFGGLYTVARTGKPRKAVTPTEAVLVVVIDVAIVTLLVLAALRIGA